MAETNPGASGSASAHVEVKARTVDEAIARGLVRLGGLARTEVDIEIVNEGKPGLLGFGAEEAVVRLTPLGADAASEAAAPSERASEVDGPTRRRRRRRRRGRAEDSSDEAGEREEATEAKAEPKAPAPPPEPPARRRKKKAPQRTERRDAAPRVAAERPTEPAAPQVQPEFVTPAGSQEPVAARAPREPLPEASEEEILAMAQGIVQDILNKLGFEGAQVDLEPGLLPTSLQEEDSAVLSIHGEGTERLLARDGSSLRALQFITRLLVSRRTESWTSVLLDVDGDRRRQIKELLALAEQSADLVENGGRPVSLPPMGAYERRVVHIALKDHPTIATQSIGSGDRRKVTVRRKDQLLPDM
jgi:spoIIIJ-associated protein